MLGDILGRKAGEIAACEVLCRFLLILPPRFGLLRFSLDPFAAFIPEDRGVLSALSFGVFADKVGVLLSS